MYIQIYSCFNIEVIYLMPKKGIPIIENIDKGKIRVVETTTTTKLMPPIKPNKDIIYISFSHKLLSENLMGKNFRELEKKFKDLKDGGHLEDKYCVNILNQTNFYRKLFSHGAYTKYLGNIDGKDWISVTSITTKSKKFLYDDERFIIPIKIEGIEKDLYVGCTVILKVDDFNNIIKSLDNENSERWNYDKKERPIIIEQINKLSEEDRLIVVNFEKYKELIDLSYLLDNDNVVIKDKLYKILDEEKTKKFNVLSKNYKEKIDLFKTYNKVLNNKNSNDNINTNTEL